MPLSTANSGLHEKFSINFYFEDIEAFSFPYNTDQIVSWVHDTIVSENKELISLSFIFCSDDYLHKINLEYLNHDTYTDVITFHYNQLPFIEGDIFISKEMVTLNAKNEQVSFFNELLRVMVHGVLHLCGYNDGNSEEKKLMRVKENLALKNFSF